MNDFLHYGYGIVITLAWLTFLAYWIYASRTAKKTVKRTNISWTMRLTLVAILIIVGFTHLHLPGYHSSPAVGWIGAALAVIGVGYAIYARRYLGQNWGMPMRVKEDPDLVTSGPYAYVRHPIYSGMLLTMIGSLAAAGVAWLIILVIYFVYFVYSAKKEEKLLAETFPDTYPAYKARTKMLIPFVF